MVRSHEMSRPATRAISAYHYLVKAELIVRDYCFFEFADMRQLESTVMHDACIAQPHAGTTHETSLAEDAGLTSSQLRSGEKHDVSPDFDDQIAAQRSYSRIAEASRY